MNTIQQPIFALTATNAGGEGKTTLARLSKALWEMADYPAEILDGDNGNRAASKADNTAQAVGWGAGPTLAQKMFSAHEGRHAIFDLGANALASEREIADLVPELGNVFAAGGYRCVAFMPLSTNKLGAGGSLLALGADLTQFEKVYVRVNRDLSNNYDPEFNPTSYVDLGYLDPGFQAYFEFMRVSMAQAVLQPPPEYKTAAAHLAYWMLEFVRQPEIEGIFGSGPAEAILKAYPEAPPAFRLLVLHLAAATNEALAENAHKTKMLDLLDKYGWDPTGLRLAAAFVDP